VKEHADDAQRSTGDDDAALVCSLDEDNPAVEAQLARNAPNARPALTPERGLVESRRALEFSQFIRGTLLPAYRLAVDAIDPMASAELATHIVSAYRAVERARTELAETYPPNDPARALVSTADSPIDDTESAAMSRWLELQLNESLLIADEPMLGTEIVSQVSAQKFRGADVIPGAVAPLPKKNGVARIANEAGSVVELLSVVLEVRNLAGTIGTECVAEIPPEQRDAIAHMIEPYHTRPIDFAFLVRVLRDECLWELVEGAKGESGRPLAATLDKTLAQAEQTGAFQDMGGWDAEKIQQLLADADDDNAFQVFLELKYMPPSARGPAIRQIDQMGLLGNFCDHVGWQYVKGLADVIRADDGKAAGLLDPYWENEGGGKSLHKIYEENAMENIEEGGTINLINAYGWVFLDTAHNALTGGFLHEYSAAYDAREEGWITDDEYYSASGKALGKAAVITAAAAITGGVVGPYAEGFAAGLGAGEGAAAVIGGGVGGFAAGVSGHFAGDVYDQMLNGKEGFDSAGSYLESGALGAGSGMALAGVSVLAGKYLPASQQRMGDIYAARYPRMMRMFEQIRRAGARDGADFAAGNAAAYRAVRTRVRMTVRELKELFDTFGGAPPALAGGGTLDSLPPDTIVEATLVSDDLNRPMQMSSNEENGGGNSNEKPTVTEPDEPRIQVEDITVEEPPPEAQVSTADDQASTEPVTEATPQQTPTETQAPQPTTEEQVVAPQPQVQPKPRRVITPDTVDDAVNTMKATGRLTGEMGQFDSKVALAKSGNVGALGELEGVQRWLDDGSTVEVLPERANEKLPNGQFRKFPDYRVNGKITELKSRLDPMDEKWIRTQVSEANKQVRRSGFDETGQLELQLRGPEATRVTVEEIEAQLDYFTEEYNRGIDRVAVYKDGELFAEWIRNADGTITRKFP